jgi:hypothetical protein
LCRADCQSAKQQVANLRYEPIRFQINPIYIFSIERRGGCPPQNAAASFPIYSAFCEGSRERAERIPRPNREADFLCAFVSRRLCVESYHLLFASFFLAM